MFARILSVSSKSKTLMRRFSSQNKLNVKKVIADKLEPAFMDVADESASHFEAHDSHFKVYVVSDLFKGKMLIKR